MKKNNANLPLKRDFFFFKRTKTYEVLSVIILNNVLLRIERDIITLSLWAMFQASEKTRILRG